MLEGTSTGAVGVWTCEDSKVWFGDDSNNKLTSIQATSVKANNIPNDVEGVKFFWTINNGECGNVVKEVVIYNNKPEAVINTQDGSNCKESFTLKANSLIAGKGNRFVGRSR